MRGGVQARDRVADLDAQLKPHGAKRTICGIARRSWRTWRPSLAKRRSLAQRRHVLMNREKVVSTLSDALAAVSGEGGALARLGAAERRLERSAGLAPELLEPAASALGRALIEAGEAEAVLESALRDMESERGTLEAVEERLFALRDAARKHRVTVDALPDLLDSTRDLLQRIDTGAEALNAVPYCRTRGRERVPCCRPRPVAGPRRGRDASSRVPSRAELPPLRLDRAKFRVQLDPLPEDDWGAEGAERVAFEVCTNPGQPLRPAGARSPPVASCRASCWRSRWSWPGSMPRRP